MGSDFTALELMIKHLFLATVETNCDSYCPAVQRAVDELAKEYGSDRARMLDHLRRATRSELHELVMVAWVRAPLTLATGKTRSEWLRLIDAEARREYELLGTSATS